MDSTVNKNNKLSLKVIKKHMLFIRIVIFSTRMFFEMKKITRKHKKNHGNNKYDSKNKLHSQKYTQFYADVIQTFLRTINVSSKYEDVHILLLDVRI